MRDNQVVPVTGSQRSPTPPCLPNCPHRVEIRRTVFFADEIERNLHELSYELHHFVVLPRGSLIQRGLSEPEAICLNPPGGE
jgi:hypothetical protein